MDWSLLLGNGLVSALLIALLGWYTNSRLKKLETDLQKEMRNYSLYAEKKHETYQQLSEAVAKAINHVSTIWNPYQRYPDFRRYTEEEIEQFLKEHGFKQKMIQEMITELKFNTDKAIKELNHIYDLSVKGAEMYKAYNNYVERIYIAEIYISKEVLDLAKKIAEKIRELIIDLEHRNELKDVWKESKSVLGEIDELKTKLMEQMKKELQGIKKT